MAHHLAVDRGSCAFAAIRKHVVKLNRCITQGQIPERLFADELIGEDAWELCLKGEILESDKGKKIAREVQKNVRICPEMMDQFVEILRTEKVTEELAKEIQGK